MKKPPHAFVLGLVIWMIPLCLLLVFSLANLVISDAGASVLHQKKTQLFHMAEAGMTIAEHNFAEHAFLAATHQGGAAIDPLHWNALTPPPGFTRDDEGWHRWQWRREEGRQVSFTHTGLPEEYRYSIDFLGNDRWRMVCEARLGDVHTEHQQTGVLESLRDYAFFDDGDLSEFTRLHDQLVIGKIHANGNIFFRPWGTTGFGLIPPSNPTLKVRSESVTAAGMIVRHTDAWGVPDRGGDVLIERRPPPLPGGPGPGPGPPPGAGDFVLMDGFNQGAVGKGNAFDSFHPNWADREQGALERWRGAVQDGVLGAVRRAAPGRTAAGPGGIYDRNAGLRIDQSTSNSWCKPKTFYNQAEGREVTVRELNMKVLAKSGAFPANGLIYADAPLRVLGAKTLPAPTTIVCSSTIYLQGDFNQEVPGASDKQPAALITNDRIYKLSSSFTDQASYTTVQPTTPAATDEGTPPDVLEINAMLVDGAPTVDGITWVSQHRGETNPRFLGDNQGMGVSVISLFPFHVVFPNSDDFLENLSRMQVNHAGPTVHLQSARMARLDNSDASEPGITPWILRSNYLPPIRRDTMDRSLTEDPPYTPRVSRKLLWQVSR